MKRTVITMDGNGELSIPSNLKDLWMSEGELVDMLHVTCLLYTSDAADEL